MRDFVGSGQVDVSIVMPCLNEAETLGDCVRVAQEAIDTLSRKHSIVGEVVIADNGSTDGSQQIALAGGARVVDISERGYGAALRGGFAEAEGRYLVMGDSDCSYDFREAVPMVEKLMGGAEFCMGSRFKGEIKPGAMPWKNRYIGNPVLSGILRLLYRTPISDSHCGLRAIRRDTYTRLNLSADGMEFASEMVLKSALAQVDIAEVPVTLSPDGRSRAPHLNPWRDGLRHLFYMFMLCPTWLFLAPAALLATFGLAVFAMLLGNPDAEMVRLGQLGIGDHWAVVAASAMIIASQSMIAGTATLVLGVREKYLKPTARARRWIARSSLSTWLVAGLSLFAIGLIWSGSIAFGWMQSGYAELHAMRSLIAAFTLIVIGAQTGFGGFLLSIVAGNKLRHGAVLG